MTKRTADKVLQRLTDSGWKASITTCPNGYAVQVVLEFWTKRESEVLA